MKRLVAVAVTALLGLAACGGDDGGTSSTDAVPAAPSTTATPTSDVTATTEATTGTSGTTAESSTTTEASTTESTGASSTGDVTVTHAYGDTVVAARPERIVSLDTQWTDVLTALGHPPVAATVDPGQGGWYPWQRPDGIEAIEVTDTPAIPYESVARYAPDLIVGSWEIADRSSYDSLTRIAPTIASLGGGGELVDKWEDIAVAAGEILGEQDAAAELVADVQQVGAELTGLDGKTYVLANYVPGDQIYVVADPDDGAAQLFGRLGMSIDPEMLALDSAGTGRVAISLEQIDELDADVLLILTNGAAESDIPGFGGLPAVQSGAYAVLEYGPVVGINTPTPLSIPYSFEFIRPALEAAAS